MHSSSPLALLLLAPLLGCTPKAADGPTCSKTVTDVSMDEVTAIGVAAATVVADLPATEDATLVYADSARTPLALQYTPGESARFVDQEAVYPEGGAQTDIGIICDDYVAFDVDMTLTSDDGVFAESFTSEVQAGADATGHIWQELDLLAMGGSFDIADYTTASDWTDASAWVQATLDGDGTTSGVISGQVSGEDPCDSGDTCSAWAENVDVGTWGDGDE